MPPHAQRDTATSPLAHTAPAAASRLQVVVVELCAERKPILTADKLREPTLTEVLTEIRAGRASPFQGIYSW